MTTRNLKWAALAAVSLSAALGAERAETYSDALSGAGEDGVIVYCYGPDWNARSVRMLESFWKSPELEKAAGNAKLVAVPYYQGDDPTGKAADIRSGFCGPSFSVCPSVSLLDSSGNRYAELVGTDGLGDETGAAGIKAIAEKLEAHRKQLELMEKAAITEGAEKAKLISEACDLGIAAPKGAVADIEAADPDDKTGCVRRQKFDALQFMYKQLDTTDGFLAPDFVPDMPQMTKDCMAVFNDKSYKDRDRQAAMNLLIGANRRNFMAGGQLKNLITKDAKVNKETDYGRLLPFLVDDWGNARQKMTSEERKKLAEAKKAAKERDKEAKKSRKDKDSRNKKADRDTTIE